MADKALLKDTPLAKLGLEELGSALVMLVPTCLTLGHQSLESTFGYVHGEPGGTAEFIRDLFTRPPGEVAEKWYGSEDAALTLFANAMGRAMSDDGAEPATCP